MQRPGTSARRGRWILSVAARVSGASALASVAATPPAEPQWSDWKPTTDPAIEFRYRIHGHVAAKFQLRSSSSIALTARFTWLCPSTDKFFHTVPEGFVTVPAGGVSEIQTLGVEDCTDPTPTGLKVVSQPA